MATSSQKPTGESQASQLNRMVMRKLQKALEADPEVDLASKIPSTYASRLAIRKAEACCEVESPSKRLEIEARQFPEDARHFIDGNASATVLFSLSESVRRLIKNDHDEASLTYSVHKLIKQSDVVWKPTFGSHKIVLKCSPDVALKIIHAMSDFTEYTMLQYLEKYKPNIPAPRPLGLIRLGKHFLIFMSLIPGTTLEAVWPQLSDSLKRSVQEQLNDSFVDLRSSTRPADMPLGGVAGEGCQDLRRHVRRTKKPIWTTEDFDNWQFSNPHFGSPIYIETLRRLSPPLSQKHVLSHNDLRPENIMVKLEEGQCHLTGIIDWQYGGYYPEYYESTKVMNALSTNEASDWFLFVPECISPLQHAQKWLLDALWWKHVE